MKLRVITIGLGLTLILTGCGGNTSGTVENYGGTSTGQEQVVQGLDSFPKTRFGDSDIVYEETFAIGNVPAEIRLQSITWDMDQLYTRKMHIVTKDSIQEEQMIHAFFGDTAMKVDREAEEEDAYRLRELCEAFQRVYHPENVIETKDKYSISYDFETLPTWEDGSGFFYHTWEGKHDGTDYWLILGFREDTHSEIIRFYPKNPGELIGKPSFSQFEVYNTSWGGLTLADGRKIQDILGGKKNRTTKNDNSLKEMASNFASETLQVSIPPDDMTFTDADDSRYIVYFINGGTISEDRYEDAVVDGYRMNSRGMHSDYGVDFLGLYSFTPEDENRVIDNQSTVYLHDSGIIAGEYLIAYLPTESEEGALILSLDPLISAFKSHMVENLDLSNANGRSVTLKYMKLIYYPIPSKEDPTEYSYVPTWEMDLRWNNNSTLATVYINAIDGSLIDIHYTRE